MQAATCIKSNRYVTATRQGLPRRGTRDETRFPSSTASRLPSGTASPVRHHSPKQWHLLLGNTFVVEADGRLPRLNTPGVVLQSVAQSLLPLDARLAGSWLSFGFIGWPACVSRP
mgnify:FL=1